MIFQVSWASLVKRDFSYNFEKNCPCRRPFNFEVFRDNLKVLDHNLLREKDDT